MVEEKTTKIYEVTIKPKMCNCPEFEALIKVQPASQGFLGLETSPNPRLLIAFLGEQYSGKSTCAHYLRDKYGFKVISFADPFKDATVRMVQEFVPKVDRAYMEAHKDQFRLILQGIGNDCIKPILGEDVWARWALDHLSPEDTRVTVDDMRFSVEAGAWREVGGIIIKVESCLPARRLRKERKEGKPVDPIKFAEHAAHRSETEVSQITPDFTIVNDGSYSDLFLAVEKILSGLPNFK